MSYRGKRRKSHLVKEGVPEIDRRKATYQNAPFSRIYRGHYYQKSAYTPFKNYAERIVETRHGQGFKAHYIKWGRFYVVYEGLGEVKEKSEFGVTITR